VHGEFRQSSAEPRIKAVPMSHLSIEIGHLYLDDLKAGTDRLKQVFVAAAPWAQAAEQAQIDERPRTSTCFLVDDYSSDLSDVGPAEVLPELLSAADEAGVRIDYLARESACARVTGPAGTVSPAQLLVSQLVAEPAPETNGARPPAVESGWLSNGTRSPGEAEASAMEVELWEPPAQTAARGHSIFVDVELWNGIGEQRVWSCPLLAATWQLLRLGLSRQLGEPLVEPVPAPAVWPSSWSDLPGVLQLNPRAKPFAAYRTMSILTPTFLEVELAVRTILSQVWHDPEVTGLLTDLAGKEGVSLPADALDRIGYVFAGLSRSS
jgi:hypothetical protein